MGQDVISTEELPILEEIDIDPDFSTVISTGSTLLDLAISGGRVRGGGIPTGILVEIFGPAGAGKTVLLSELAGDVQRKKGDVIFFDPEARLNKQFVRQFDFDPDDIEYLRPKTVTEMFNQIHELPENDVLKGVFADSLAALSTNLEMDDKDGDKMGMRRAKEFSEQLRKNALKFADKNMIMVASNQVRVNTNAGQYQVKYTSTGGASLSFYSSLRLRTGSPKKLSRKLKIKGKDYTDYYGVETMVEVHKSSIWKPYGTAAITIVFDYGVDDIRDNLQYLKKRLGGTVYAIGDMKLHKSMEESIQIVEEDNLQNLLKNEVIDTWEAIQEELAVKYARKPKQR